MKKKILILIPSLVGGGAERTLINLLNSLDYDKYEVDLAVISYVGVYVEQVPREVRVIAIFKWNLLVRVLAFLQKKYGFSQFFKYRARQKLNKEYDVGISFIDSNFTDILFFTKVKKVITWVHTSYASYSNFSKFYSNSAYRNKLKKERYNNIDSIIFVSQDAKKEFISIFGSYPNMPVIYNIIGKERIILQSQKRIGLKKNKFTFIAIGSLLPVKGFDRLIRAASLVKKAGYVFSLLILGEGTERQRLENLIVQKEISSDVKLLGFRENPYPYLAMCDAFVMSSISEALPTVLCEAMILGKPIIVTNCSGCRELVDIGEYGLMAEQDDQSLADKMIKYIKEPKTLLNYAKKSKKRSQLFDDEEVIRRVYSVIDN